MAPPSVPRCSTDQPPGALAAGRRPGWRGRATRPLAQSPALSPPLPQRSSRACLCSKPPWHWRPCCGWRRWPLSSSPCWFTPPCWAVVTRGAPTALSCPAAGPSPWARKPPTSLPSSCPVRKAAWPVRAAAHRCKSTAPTGPAPSRRTISTAAMGWTSPLVVLARRVVISRTSLQSTCQFCPNRWCRPSGKRCSCRSPWAETYSRRWRPQSQRWPRIPAISTG